MPNNIVIIGYVLLVRVRCRLTIALSAGVSGLTTAYLLSKDVSNHITVVSKHMPGDYDIEYCSPWAGANFFPYVARQSILAL